MTILALTLLTFSLQANPFACKIKNQKKARRPGKHQSAPTFVGYAIMENQQFAIVQLNKNQYIVKQGESIGRVKIIRFTADSLVYEENDGIFSVPIYHHRP